jgi:hypothetical protein
MDIYTTKTLLELKFTNLLKTPYAVTSPENKTYNCIAWAAGQNNLWWWPDPYNIYYWPKKAPRETSLKAFIIAYECIGYIECEDGEFEQGFEKIVIYKNDKDLPTHASRQTSPGKWTSKLGRLCDIEHTIEGLNGSEYGTPAVFMKRPESNKNLKARE